MLKYDVEYSHRLATPAKIPVYLQVLLLLLSWLSLHLPSGAYKPRTSHARSPANTIPIGRLQCKLFVYSCSLSVCHKHIHTDTHTNTHLQKLQGLQVHTNTAVYTSVVTLGLHHNKHPLVKINYMPKGHSFSLTISVSMVTPFDLVSSPGVMLLIHHDAISPWCWVTVAKYTVLKIMLLPLAEWPSQFHHRKHIWIFSWCLSQIMAACPHRLFAVLTSWELQLSNAEWTGFLAKHEVQ